MSVQNLKNPLTKNYLDYKNYVLAEGNIQHISSAEEDKIIIFNGEYNHFQGTPKIDENRIVLVANYI